MLRLAAGALALALAAGGAALGWIALVALRRSEGVFLPTGYVAVALLAMAGFLARWVIARG